MQLPLTERVVPRLLVRESSASTNSELLALDASGPVDDFTTLLTFDQTAGRGRAGREWVSPPGTALAISVLTPRLDRAAAELGWVPLVAGLAMSRSVASELPHSHVSVKWPNDVLVRERKVCGILAEIAVSGRVVVGAGVNVRMTPDQLPVPTATSLLSEGGSSDAGIEDRLAATYLTLFQRYFAELFDESRREAVTQSVRDNCDTLGRWVRVELPGDAALVGRAEGIDSRGRLVVRASGREHSVSAGDVVHVRRAEAGPGGQVRGRDFSRS